MLKTILLKKQGGFLTYAISIYYNFLYTDLNEAHNLSLKCIGLEQDKQELKNLLLKCAMYSGQFPNIECDNIKKLRADIEEALNERPN